MTLPRTFLTGVAATMLVVANIVAAKIVAVQLPLLGTVSASAGVFPIAVSFLATDIISEEYGRGEARLTVWTMIGTLILSYGVLMLAVYLPHSGGVPQSSFATTLSASTPLVIASVVTGTVSQIMDVELFHEIKSFTNGRYRWVRNIGSTSVSQLVDTSVFTILAFVVFPSVIGGSVLSWGVVISIIIVEYVVKLLLAIFDTPVFLAVTTNSRGENND
jgi:uncharacterized integral membrane protein (TIGR00697 family)